MWKLSDEETTWTAKGRGLYINLIREQVEVLGLQRMEGWDEACLHNFLECPGPQGHASLIGELPGGGS